MNDNRIKSLYFWFTFILCACAGLSAAPLIGKIYLTLFCVACALGIIFSSLASFEIKKNLRNLFGWILLIVLPIFFWKFTLQQSALPNLIRVFILLIIAGCFIIENPSTLSLVHFECIFITIFSACLPFIIHPRYQVALFGLGLFVTVLLLQITQISASAENQASQYVISNVSISRRLILSFIISLLIVGIGTIVFFIVPKYTFQLDLDWGRSSLVDFELKPKSNLRLMMPYQGGEKELSQSEVVPYLRSIFIKPEKDENLMVFKDNKWKQPLIIKDKKKEEIIEDRIKDGNNQKGLVSEGSDISPEDENEIISKASENPESKLKTQIKDLKEKIAKQKKLYNLISFLGKDDPTQAGKAKEIGEKIKKDLKELAQLSKDFEKEQGLTAAKQQSENQGSGGDIGLLAKLSEFGKSADKQKEKKDGFDSGETDAVHGKEGKGDGEQGRGEGSGQGEEGKGDGEQGRGEGSGQGEEGNQDGEQSRGQGSGTGDKGINQDNKYSEQGQINDGDDFQSSSGKKTSAGQGKQDLGTKPEDRDQTEQLKNSGRAADFQGQADSEAENLNNESNNTESNPGNSSSSQSSDQKNNSSAESDSESKTEKFDSKIEKENSSDQAKSKSKSEAGSEKGSAKGSGGGGSGSGRKGGATGGNGESSGGNGKSGGGSGLGGGDSPGSGGGGMAKGQGDEKGSNGEGNGGGEASGVGDKGGGQGSGGGDDPSKQGATGTGQGMGGSGGSGKGGVAGDEGDPGGEGDNGKAGDEGEAIETQSVSAKNSTLAKDNKTASGNTLITTYLFKFKDKPLSSFWEQIVIIARGNAPKKKPIVNKSIQDVSIKDSLKIKSKAQREKAEVSVPVLEEPLAEEQVSSNNSNNFFWHLFVFFAVLFCGGICCALLYVLFCLFRKVFRDLKLLYLLTFNFKKIIAYLYRNILFVLKKTGLNSHEFLTPKEIGDIAVSKFNLSKPAVESLTNEFEKSRYSNHEITKNNISICINAYNQLKKDIIKNKTFLKKIILSLDMLNIKKWRKL